MPDSTSLPLFKRCASNSKCLHPNGPLLPATPEFFNRRSKNKDGLRAECRICQHEDGRQYHANNLDKEHERVRRYNAAHREKLCDYQNRWHRENPGKNQEFSKRWRDKHPGAQSKADKKYNGKYPERRKRKSQIWFSQNREKARIYSQRRRTLKLALPDNFNVTDWNRALGYFSVGGVCSCAVCKRPIGLWHTLAQDHWIPLADTEHCPGTVKENIVPLCHGIGGCNNEKSARDPVEWLTSRFGPRKAKRILARIQAYFDSLKDDNNE